MNKESTRVGWLVHNILMIVLDYWTFKIKYYLVWEGPKLETCAYQSMKIFDIIEVFWRTLDKPFNNKDTIKRTGWTRLKIFPTLEPSRTTFSSQERLSIYTYSVWQYLLVVDLELSNVYKH